MQYNFNSNIAKEYGVDEAVFIQNIFYWINHNEANGRHFYQERYWTYNTKNAFAKLFPFWTYAQVRNIIKKLMEKNVLLVGNFNENSWDKTSWFSLSDEVVEMLKNDVNTNKNASAKNDKSSCQISPIELSELTIRTAKNDQSNIGTNNKPYNKTQIEGALAFFENNFPSAYEALMMQFKMKIKDFQKFRTLFDAKVETEKLEYDQRVLSGRFISFATNWIENEKKEAKVIELYEGPKHKIGGF
jgi:hypothetical protein